MRNGLIIDEHGTKYWFLNGQLHRVNGPAVEWADGTKWWSLNGQFHRVDGPAIEYADGRVEYWVNGVKISKKRFLSDLFQVELVNMA